MQEYLSQILEALNALHTVDLVHRGLSLSSIGLAPPCPSEVHPTSAKRVKVFNAAYLRSLLDQNRSEPFLTNNDRKFEQAIPDGSFVILRCCLVF